MPSFEQKWKEMEGPSDVPSDSYYPGMHLDGKPAKALSHLEVGQEYDMTIRVKVISKSQRESKSGSQDGLSLDVLSGEVVSDSGNAADAIFNGE